MEIILLVESVSEERTFEVTNNYGGKNSKTVATIVGNTASGRVAVDAFGDGRNDVLDRLKNENVGPGSVLVAEIGFRANEFTKTAGGTFWRNDLRIINFVMTCKRQDAVTDPEIF